MKALILGAGGQVGRALIVAAPRKSMIVPLSRGECDLSDEVEVRAQIEVHRPDFVFNAAAYTSVDKAETDPATARLVNGMAPGWIAEASASIGARLVHLSTDFVFDGGVPYPLAPSSPVRPINVYGASKLEGERAVMRAQPEALIVRTAWVYAAEGANFMRTMLRLLQERDEVRVVADQIGTPTWAASLADALWRLAAMSAVGIHHFTDAGLASWYDFAVAIQEEARTAGLLGRPARIVPISTSDHPTPARRPAFSVLDKSATWALLGSPPPHWRVNLRTCLGREYRD